MQCSTDGASGKGLRESELAAFKRYQEKARREYANQWHPLRCSLWKELICGRKDTQRSSAVSRAEDD